MPALHGSEGPDVLFLTTISHPQNENSKGVSLGYTSLMLQSSLIELVASNLKTSLGSSSCLKTRSKFNLVYEDSLPEPTAPPIPTSPSQKQSHHAPGTFSLTTASCRKRNESPILTEYKTYYHWMEHTKISL